MDSPTKQRINPGDGDSACKGDGDVLAGDILGPNMSLNQHRSASGGRMHAGLRWREVRVPSLVYSLSTLSVELTFISHMSLLDALVGGGRGHSTGE